MLFKASVVPVQTDLRTPSRTAKRCIDTGHALHALRSTPYVCVLLSTAASARHAGSAFALRLLYMQNDVVSAAC